MDYNEWQKKRESSLFKRISALIEETRKKSFKTCMQDWQSWGISQFETNITFYLYMEIWLVVFVKYKWLFDLISKIGTKKLKMELMFDKEEFVAVCKKHDYENGDIRDGIFLVFKNEWNNTDDDPMETFDLLLASVVNNIVKLYPMPNNAVVIVEQVPYSEKSDYIEISNI